jgi:sodium-dependent dicarboxylate transporter 2/3/5
MALLFALTALLWITRPSLDLGFVRLPGWSELFGLGVSDASVATAMALAAFLIPAGAPPGPRLMDWHTAQKLPWDVLLLFGAGFAIAGAFERTGLDRVLGEALAPLFTGAPEWVLVAAVVLLVALVSEVTSNVATAAAVLPVLGQAAAAAGISPLTTMLPAAVAASAAFMLPVGTPPNAIAFGTRLVPAPTMARAGLWLDLGTVVLVTLVFELWARRVFEIGPGLPAWAG